jgi:L-fuculose-phosphate aldolase
MSASPLDPIWAARVQIARLGRMMFERRLTDAAGGNISARVGDRVCITPRYAGSQFQWHLRPEQVLVSDLDGRYLEGEGELSREAKVHHRLYREFAEGQAVVHGHPRNALVFAAACRPIEPVLEDTLKFGTIHVTGYAPAHSADLAEHNAAALRGQQARIQKQAAAVLAPWHGLFVLGKDLNAAFDAAERIDVNAYCLLMSRLLPGPPADPAALAAALADRHAAAR